MHYKSVYLAVGGHVHLRYSTFINEDSICTCVHVKNISVKGHPESEKLLVLNTKTALWKIQLID